MAFHRTWILVLATLLATSCGNPAAPAPTSAPSQPTLPGNTIVVPLSKVVDAAGTDLGQVYGAFGSNLSIISPTNYCYILWWDGTIHGSGANYTGPDGTGTPFVMTTVENGVNPRAIYLHGTSLLAFPASLTADPGITGYQSTGVTPTNSTGTIPSGTFCYPLVPISFAAAGIPTTIHLPLRLSIPSTTAAKTAVAYDGANTKLGYCVPTATQISVTSPTGYYYSLQWDGNLVPENGMFTGADGTGTPVADRHVVSIAKQVLFIHQQLFTYRDADTFGNSVPDPTLTVYSSYSPFGDPSTLVNYEGTLNSTVNFALKPITRTAAGIPSSITLPIAIRYE